MMPHVISLGVGVLAGAICALLQGKSPAPVFERGAFPSADGSARHKGLQP